MPRTKKPRSHEITHNDTGSVQNLTTYEGKDLAAILKEINDIKTKRIQLLTELKEQKMQQVTELCQQGKWGTKRNIANMTTAEVLKYVADKSGSVVVQKSSVKQPVSTQRRLRSSSCSSTQSKTTARKRSLSVDSREMPPLKYKTPVNQGIQKVPVVTPKINPQVPMAVLRRPHQGEYALSLHGSPLLVSGVTYDKTASVSVPMSDGRVISILPTEGIDGAGLTLDAETRKQLLMLNKNLMKCLQK